MARLELPSPGLMVVWQGTKPGSRGEFNAWKHQFSIYLRAKAETGDPPDGYYKLYTLIMTGVPANGDGQQMQYATIHSECLPMDDMPEISRQADISGVDIFEISLSFTEIA